MGRLTTSDGIPISAYPISQFENVSEQKLETQDLFYISNTEVSGYHDKVITYKDLRSQLLRDLGIKEYCDVVVTANPPSGGSVTGSGNYLINTSVTVNAIAAQGYEFYKWTGSFGELTDKQHTFNVNSDITMVAHFQQNTREVSFKTVDSKSFIQFDPDQISVNGESISHTYSAGFSTIRVPNVESFRIRISKDGYVDIDQDYSYSELNGTIIPMTKIQGYGELEGKNIWPVDLDFDTHVQVFNGTQRICHVYYVSKNYANSQTSVTLDHDDLGRDGESVHAETITVNPTYSKYKYAVYVHNFSDRNSPTSTRLSDSGSKMTITYSNKTETVQIPSGKQGIYWNVFEVEDNIVTVINTVTTTCIYN